MREKRPVVVIRDDDLSFFTSINDLKKAYDFLDENDSVSFSVVYNSVPTHKDSIFPYGKNIPFKQYCILKNKELCEYLKDNYENAKIDLLLHGYSHEYKQINGKWLPEFLWKSKSVMLEEIQDAICSLRDYFGERSFKIFVPPNNQINSKGVKCITKFGMDISGQIRFFDRPFSLLMIKNSIVRNFYRLFYHINYGGLLKYPNHIEVNSFPVDNLDKMKKEYQSCKKMNVPFMVYTHYWSLNANQALKETLKNFIEYAKNDGAILKRMTDCFEEMKKKKLNDL